MYGEVITLMDSVVITVFSMAVVFLTLYAIHCILLLFPGLNRTQPPVATAEEADDGELVAVILAAIEAYESGRSPNPIARSGREIRVAPASGAKSPVARDLTNYSREEISP